MNTVPQNAVKLSVAQNQKLSQGGLCRGSFLQCQMSPAFRCAGSEHGVERWEKYSYNLQSQYGTSDMSMSYNSRLLRGQKVQHQNSFRITGCDCNLKLPSVPSEECGAELTDQSIEGPTTAQVWQDKRWQGFSSCV